MENLISELNLTNQSLLAVPIKDDEIFELLERLAATEEMFRAPVSTIRDVAELTEASPTLIARVLGEMRGPGELEQMVGRLDEHDRRLLEVEQKVSRLGKQTTETPKEPAYINKPKIVGSTVQKGRARAPRTQEPPPTAWIEKKRDEEIARYKEQEKKTAEFSAMTNMYLVYLALAVVVIWILYSVLKTPVSPPDIIPIIR